MLALKTDERFYDWLELLVETMVDQSRAVERFVTNPDQYDAVWQRLLELESDANDTVQRIVDALSETFAAPLAPEDIYAIACRLQKIAALRKRFVTKSILFGVLEFPPETIDLVGMVSASVARVGTLVSTLRYPKQLLLEVGATKQQAMAAKSAYERVIPTLFTRSPDPLCVVKWKDLYDQLERIVDACNRAALTVQTVALKHA